MVLSIAIYKFSISHLFAHSEVVSSIAHTNDFICTQLNCFKYSYLTNNSI